VRQVAAVIGAGQAPARRLERLETAVAEATMNAMEHGNGFQAHVPVTICVLTSAAAVAVRITDQGGSHLSPDPIAPDLVAKLAGLQSPRGWGLFLIEHLVDEMRVSSTDTEHTVELILYSRGVTSARSTTGSALTAGEHDRDRSARAYAPAGGSRNGLNDR
jgi:anti-sigma regulatory factor (Ser/Thr protein kinase)